jgi:hypothetical protein
MVCSIGSPEREVLVHALSVAITFGQISTRRSSSRDPEHRVEHLPRVAPGPSCQCWLGPDERCCKLPFFVANFVSMCHEPIPPVPPGVISISRVFRQSLDLLSRFSSQLFKFKKILRTNSRAESTIFDPIRQDNPTRTVGGVVPPTRPSPCRPLLFIKSPLIPWKAELLPQGSHLEGKKLLLRFDTRSAWRMRNRLCHSPTLNAICSNTQAQQKGRRSTCPRGDSLAYW